MKMESLIYAARGEKEADLLLTNARVVDVFSGRIFHSHIAVSEGYIVGFGEYRASSRADVQGKYVAPGFIDSHVHIESSMTCVNEFARALLPLGTTTVIADPHEIANVLGIEGINFMLGSSEGQLMNIYFALPSCVPATNLETSGARLSAEDLLPFMKDSRVVALGELMNFPGVINCQREVLRKIEISKVHGKPIDGHAPGLTGGNLFAYAAAGISSDHECTTAEEAREKLSAGIHIMIRQGTGAQNLKALLEIINKHNSYRLMWCTDDKHPNDIVAEGHIDYVIRSAIDSGIDSVTAIQMATINPASYFGLTEVGAISPGRRADMVVFSDLAEPIVEKVYCRGILAADGGKVSPAIESPSKMAVPPSMKIQLQSLDFSIPVSGSRMRVIEAVPEQLITHHKIMDARVVDSLAVADTSRDIIKIAVVERHQGTGNVGKGFLKGLGLRRGAIASTVAHDSHNIIVAGVNDRDMRAAVEVLEGMGGGLAAVCDEKLIAGLPLPIGGLMSYDSLGSVAKALDLVISVAVELGAVPKDPFMTLSFLALPVIPELKITDKGLVDVINFCFVPLFAP